MNRLLSSIGIGAATVDTLLPKTEFTPGETVEATVEMTGWNAEQEIDGLYFALLTRVDDEHVVVDQDEITESVSLAPGETRTLTTEVTVPPWTPITEGECRVWLKTGLDISWAVDPNDEDAVDVVSLFEESLSVARLEVWASRLDVETEYERLKRA